MLSLLFLPVCHTHNLPKNNAPPSVAYLFTLRGVGSHPLERAWSRYFDGCPAHSVTLLSHTDVSSMQKKPATSPSGVFAGSMIKESIKVRRFSYSMVRARLLLLRSAMNSTHSDWEQRRYLARRRPVWFLFLSDSCAPLLPCAEVHHYLERHSPRSFVGAEPCNDHNRLRNATSHIRQNCRTGPGWVGLHQSAAQLLLRKEHAYEPRFLRLGVPDELYWSTVLLLEGLPIVGRHLTFWSWSGHGAPLSLAHGVF